MHPLVVHCKSGRPFDVYVGRPSIFGNLWSNKLGTIANYLTKTIEEAVRNYEDWLTGQRFTNIEQEKRAEILRKLPELSGKILACWCHKSPCHAEVLAKLSYKGN